MAAAGPAAAAAGPGAVASAADAMIVSDASDSDDEPVGGGAGAAERKKRKRTGNSMVAKPKAAPADLPLFNIRDLLAKIRTTGYVPTLVSVFFFDDPDGKHCWCPLRN